MQGGSLRFGGCWLEVAIAEPGGYRVVVRGRAVCDDVARVIEVYRAFGASCLFNGIHVAGLQREGDGLREVYPRIFEVAVDEERHGNKACGGRLREIACPLIDGDSSCHVLGGRDAMRLRIQRRGEECRQQNRTAKGRALEHALIRREGTEQRFGGRSLRWLLTSVPPWLKPLPGATSNGGAEAPPLQCKSPHPHKTALTSELEATLY